jgi:hypothetical protein
MQRLIKRKQGEHSEANKTKIRGSSLRDIFIDRKNVFLGLTKFETIAEYHNKKLSTILNYDKKKIDNLWIEIQYIKRYLRKKGIMGIVCERMPRGFTLNDSKFGNRQLEDGSYVYYSCSTLEDVGKYRGKLDKIAKGFYNAGTEIEEITEQNIEQKPILEAIANAQRK